MEAALSGLWVLDLTNLLPGPFAPMVLAHFGADGIKVERLGVGDPAARPALSSRASRPAMRF